MIDIIKWCKDAGSADAYYHRPPRPHFHGLGSVLWGREVTSLTDEQKQAYLEGYRDELDKKEW